MEWKESKVVSNHFRSAAARVVHGRVNGFLYVLIVDCEFNFKLTDLSHEPVARNIAAQYGFSARLDLPEVHAAIIALRVQTLPMLWCAPVACVPGMIASGGGIKRVLLAINGDAADQFARLFQAVGRGPVRASLRV